MQVRRDLGALQAQCGLDQTGDAGGRLQVTDVGLDGAEVDRRAVAAAVDVGQGLGLDGVAQAGAGAVRLDVADLVGLHPGGGQGAAEHIALGRAVGRGDAGAAAVLVDRAAAYDGQDAVLVAQGVGEPLEDDDAAALAAHVAVGAVGERHGAALPGDRAELRLGDHQQRRQHHVDAAGQRHVALSQAQALARLVDGQQRGGAGAVDGEVGAAQIEEVGDAGRYEGLGGAGTGVGADVVGVAQLGGDVVPGGGAHEHTGAAARQA